MVACFREFIFTFSLLHLVMCKRFLPFFIKGPKSYTDKIAIVGAGASGIDMALRLKNLGFTNVHILEKESRLGGKSWTIHHRGAPQEMGAVYLAPDYIDNVIPLVDKYVPDDLIFLPPASIWLDSLPGPISYKYYLGMHAMKYFKTRNETLAKIGLSAAVIKYVKLHNEIFGDYVGDIFPEPTEKVLNKTRGTFLDFLKRNNIDVIAPILYAASTIQGYGRINEIACLYGMMWNTPGLMNGLLARITGQTNSTGLYMLKSGFSHLWKTIVNEENLNITYNVNILKVYRSRDYSKVLIKKCVDGKVLQWEKYDFLIWSPEMKTSLKLWSNPEIYNEQYYFNLTKLTYFTTALLDTAGAQRGISPIDYWFDNMNNKSRDGFIWAQRDSYATVRGYQGEAYINGSYPSGNDGKNIRSTVTYQMSDREPFYTELRNTLKSALRKIGVKKHSIKVIKMKTWRYFPHFKPLDMEKGYLWRILEMQGKYGMWYIGSSVSFESVKSVIEYNKLLLKNMEPIFGKRRNEEIKHKHFF